MTPDSLPYVGPHRKYPGHLFALGYGGNGMTFGSLAARLLLEYWARRYVPGSASVSFRAAAITATLSHVSGGPAVDYAIF